MDQIYDGLLKNGVRPFVEISFMPKKLAFNSDALHAFWYKQNVSPPKSMERWDGLITHFAQHLVDRYGIDEVATRYFEVWNEPNIDFWGGVPRQRSYFELYDAEANTVRQCDGKVEELSFWTFSDVFEEGGPIDRPFNLSIRTSRKGWNQQAQLLRV